MTAKTLILFLLGSLVLLGCEKEPLEVEGTWEHEKMTPKRAECERVYPGDPDCIFGYFDNIEDEINLRLWPDSEPKIKLICNGNEKSPPRKDLIFIVNRIRERPGVCTVELTQNRKAFRAQMVTVQRIRATFEKDRTWTIEHSWFTPSTFIPPKSWMD